MPLPSRLSCASRSVTVGQAPVGVLQGAIAGTESLPARCAPMRTLNRKPVHARVYKQALLPSSSFIARKSVAGVAVCHSSFHSGLSLGRRLQISNGSRWSAVWVDNTYVSRSHLNIATLHTMGHNVWRSCLGNTLPRSARNLHYIKREMLSIFYLNANRECPMHSLRTFILRDGSSCTSELGICEVVTPSFRLLMDLEVTSVAICLVSGICPVNLDII